MKANAVTHYDGSVLASLTPDEVEMVAFALRAVSASFLLEGEQRRATLEGLLAKINASQAVSP